MYRPKAPRPKRVTSIKETTSVLCGSVINPVGDRAYDTARPLRIPGAEGAQAGLAVRQARRPLAHDIEGIITKQAGQRGE